MKFHRVSLYKEQGNSAGFVWFTSRREAEKCAKAADANAAPGERPSDIELFEVTPTRAGILDALNLYAAHPDNG